MAVKIFSLLSIIQISKTPQNPFHTESFQCYTKSILCKRDVQPMMYTAVAMVIERTLQGRIILKEGNCLFWMALNP